MKLARNDENVAGGLEESHELEITVDGAQALLETLGGKSDLTAAEANPTKAGIVIEKRLEVHVSVKAGPPRLASFLTRRIRRSPICCCSRSDVTTSIR